VIEEGGQLAGEIGSGTAAARTATPQLQPVRSSVG